MLHGYAVLVALATLALIFAGGVVTSNRSGDVDPFWPSFLGSLFPRTDGGFLHEHGHRVIAATVGLMTLILTIWLARREQRPWVRWIGFLALTAVLTQALLGGLRIGVGANAHLRETLGVGPMTVAIVHACLAQIFFCLTVTIAVVTAHRWKHNCVSERPDIGRLRRLTALTTGLIFVQLILGAVMRHRGAGLAMPGFPLPLVPDEWSENATIHFAHRVTALAIVAHVILLVTRTLGRGPRDGLVLPAIGMVVLAAAQATLGAMTVLSRRDPEPTTLHVVTGAALLGTSLVMTLRVRARPAVLCGAAA